MIENYKWTLLKTLNHLKQGHIRLTCEDGRVRNYGTMSSHFPQSNIYINNNQFYHDIFWGGSIGAGESFMKGHWTTDDLTKTIQLFARNMDFANRLESKFEWLLRPFKVLHHKRNKNKKKQAQKNISFHYDLGNDLYHTFLDPNMQYSSALFLDQSMTLAQAQVLKMKTICDKLQLKPDDHVIEIGTGWGGLAIYMAKNYGCRVTTTTISEEQFSYVQQKLEEENLTDQVTLLKKDYRDLSGTYDKLVSIEMIEAVGKEYLSSFVSQCHQLLKPQGLALIQAITIPHERLKTYSESMDFIQKHIFPGGFLPSIQLLLDHMSKETSLQLIGQQDIGLDYAKTLSHWAKDFKRNYHQLDAQKYDEQFYNMWIFYFSYCEGGFLERTISASQLLFQKVR